MKRSIWNTLFLVATFGIVFCLMVLAFQELFPEWKKYQAEYYQRLARVTGDPAKARTPVKILQIYLPNMHRVDRCITCHVGIDNSKMKGQPLPFGSHPDLGDPHFLAHHPFNEIGCTVCHQGQGPATIKEHAHGRVAHWEEPMLPKEYVASNCAVCHKNVMELKGAEILVQAKALFDEKGCLGCHSLNGAGNQIGPELSETAAKSTDQFDFRHVRGPHTVHQWIEEHFKDPQAITPGDPAQGIPESAMPNYELNDKETKMLTALVLSFAAGEEKEDHPIPSRFIVPAPPAKKPEPIEGTPAEKGRILFKKYGCTACHGVEGRGGIRNKNMAPSDEIPPLMTVSDGYTKEEVKQIIRNGRYPAKADASGQTPVLWMPAWKDKIPEDEIDAIIEYIWSLHPQTKE